MHTLGSLGRPAAVEALQGETREEVVLSSVVTNHLQVKGVRRIMITIAACDAGPQFKTFVCDKSCTLNILGTINLGILITAICRFVTSGHLCASLFFQL